MAFNVRIYGYRGMEQMPVVNQKRFSSDSVYQMVEPYEWSDVVSVSGVAVPSAPRSAPDQTRMIRVEVPDGQTIRYEINPPNRAGGVRAADAASPSLSGKDYFQFQQGWSISMIDAAGLP